MSCPLCVFATEKLSRAAELMRSRGLRRVPVIAESGELVGAVSAEEAEAALAAGVDVLACEAMSAPPAAVNRGASLREAAKRMLREGVGELYVLEAGLLLGTVKAADVFCRVGGVLTFAERGSAEPRARPASRRARPSFDRRHALRAAS